MTWIARACLLAFSLIVSYFLLIYFGRTTASWGIVLVVVLAIGLDFFIKAVNTTLDLEERMTHQSESEEEVMARIYN